MLTLIRSPIPGILQASGSLPGEVARLLERIAERPERFAWVVSTGRRKRALVKDWLAVQAGDAAKSSGHPHPGPPPSRGRESGHDLSRRESSQDLIEKKTSQDLFDWCEDSERAAASDSPRAIGRGLVPPFPYGRGSEGRGADMESRGSDPLPYGRGSDIEGR